MGQGEEHMAGDHVEDREGEDVMDERGAIRATGKKRNHFKMTPVASMTTMAGTVKMALSFWPGSSSSTSLGGPPAQCLEPGDVPHAARIAFRS